MRQITIDDIPSLWIPSYREMGIALFIKLARAKTPYRSQVFREKGKICSKLYCPETKKRYLQVDHIVPIYVAYYLNWTIEQVINMDNLQVLCNLHHPEKDKNVRELKIAAAHYNLEHQNQLSISKKINEEFVQLLPRT